MKKQLLIVTLMFLLHQLLFGQISSDQWSAEDALGRKTLTYEDVGEIKSDKYIGMFYWTWHTDNIAEWVMPD